MEKITYDMLDEFGSVVKGTFRLLYPNGLTMEELERKAKEFNWLRFIYERFKGA
jgi:hypothetical protein